LSWYEEPLVLKNISVIDEREVIVDSVSLELQPGKVTVLMGESGCGKSTVLKAAAGLIPISRGKVLYGEKQIFKITQKEFNILQLKTGFMFQDGALWANKNLQENLSLPLVIADPSSSKQQVDEKVRRALRRFGMEEYLMSRPAALSAGERKIVSFLRAVISEPEILFLDEPTTFIDRKSSLLLIKQLFRYKRAGKTIIMVTHDLSLARSIADYFVFLHNGKVELHDTVENCMQSENELWMSFKEEQNPDQETTG